MNSPNVVILQVSMPLKVPRFQRTRKEVLYLDDFIVFNVLLLISAWKNGLVFQR